MNSKRYQELKLRRRYLETLNTEEAKNEILEINEEIEQDKPTLEAVYSSILMPRP